jgi:hypothetical protein
MVKTNTFNHLELNDIPDDIVRIAVIEIFDRINKLEDFKGLLDPAPDILEADKNEAIVKAVMELLVTVERYPESMYLGSEVAQKLRAILE